MKGFVGVTDNDWFDFLSKQPEIDEVNFWQPGGRTQFKSLKQGEPFFFKLRAPFHHYIGGFAQFTHSSIIPVSLAWHAFKEKNGASSYLEMRIMGDVHKKLRNSKGRELGVIKRDVHKKLNNSQEFNYHGGRP